MSDQGAKLEQYIVLAKSARGESAAKLVSNAISAPGVYVFSELLEQPSIQDLANTSHAGHLALLQLFSYGSLADYNANPTSFPSLDNTQLLKLKHLTLLSLALANRSIPYQAISQALQIDSTRELEDLIIDVMYAGLLGGKMHHDEKILHVDWVSGRDVSPESLVDIGNALQNWCQTSQTLLTALDEEITYLRQQNVSEKSNREQYNSARNNAVAKASKSEPKKSRWAGDGNDETYGNGPPPGYEHPAFDPLRLQQTIATAENTGRLGVGSGLGDSQSIGGDDLRLSKRMKSDEMEE